MIASFENLNRIRPRAREIIDVAFAVIKVNSNDKWFSYNKNMEHFAQECRNTYDP